MNPPQAYISRIFNLVEKGNTVIIIEHNMDVIKVADYVIDMGPEGGNRGGTVVCTGTPEEVANTEGSHTGRFLKAELTIGMEKLSISRA
jgi:excinuclease ABC subunit A